MKTALLIASGMFVAVLATASIPAPAHALTAKECSAKYQTAKSAGTLNGMKWNDFRKAECGAEAPAATPPPAAEKPAPTPPPAAEKPAAPPPAAAAAEKKPATGGRAAMIARERACGAEWKAAKAAGTRPPGMKWPQYWSECDKRKKAEGM
jgi:hypothetical protein